MAKQTELLKAVMPDQLDHIGAPVDPKSPNRVEFNFKHRQVIVWLMITIVLLLIFWAWCTELEETTEAHGQLMPVTEVRPIKAGFDGIVTEVKVQAGDFVKKDDELVTLDADSFAAEKEKLEQELKILNVELQQHEHAFRILDNYLKDQSKPASNLSGVIEVAQAIAEVIAAKERLQRADLDMKVSAAGKANLTEVAALLLQHKRASEQKQLKQLAREQRSQKFSLAGC